MMGRCGSDIRRLCAAQLKSEPACLVTEAGCNSMATTGTRRCILALAGVAGLLVPRLLSAENPPSANRPASTIRGNWVGTLQVAGRKLRLATTLRVKPDGSLAGTFNSLDQDGVDRPFDKVSFNNGTVRLVLTRLNLTYEGKLSAGADEIVGQFKQRSVSLPLIFKKVARPPALRKRPQEPKGPLPYREVAVAFENAAGHARFAGTLTLPGSSGRYPAAFLITGSGQQDRNETVAGHRPFLVLADYLTRRGIAVLRVDDRGVGGSTGDVARATSEDFAGDAIAAIAYLKARPEINPNQIGLVGHSEGGLIAPMVAVRVPDVAFIVLLAGPGLPGDQILRTQAADIMERSKINPVARLLNRAVQETVLAVVKQEAARAASGKADAPTARGSGVNLAHEIATAVGSRWLEFFVTYDPRPTLEKVRCPVLALCGEKDIQVSARLNLPEIEKALRAGGNADFTVRELPNLNHLFQNCRTGNITEYVQIEETFAPSALALIGDWIRKHVSAKP